MITKELPNELLYFDTLKIILSSSDSPDDKKIVSLLDGAHCHFEEFVTNIWGKCVDVHFFVPPENFKHFNSDVKLILKEACRSALANSTGYELDSIYVNPIYGSVGKKKTMKEENTTPVLSSNTTVNDNQETKVFVTYAWGDQKHNDLVESFVNFLRKDKGFNAFMDKLETQKQSSKDLSSMMTQGIINSNKVIIVLSPEYKKKADTETGGVSVEFKMIFEELKKFHKKFILVSFGDDELSSILPAAFGNREVIDLKTDQDSDFKILIAKLNDQDLIEFSNVNPEKATTVPKKIKPFKL